jgi:colicin import membrane protein
MAIAQLTYPSSTDRLDLLPPPDPGGSRAAGMAVGAHVALVLALAWGVSWKHAPEVVTAQAELWASVPQQAAPKPVETAPQPAPLPPPAQEVITPPQIITEKIKPPPKAPEITPPKPAEKPAEDPKKKQQEELRKKAEEEQRLEAQRQENLQRMAGLAGASGGANAAGIALHSAAPSASYAGRVIARIKPNIVFTDSADGNPRVEVEIRLGPDGTIVSSRLVTASSNKAWDDAVFRAIEKTRVLPRDVDGRVPAAMVIGFRPQD